MICERCSRKGHRFESFLFRAGSLDSGWVAFFATDVSMPTEAINGVARYWELIGQLVIR